jgi:hypothetical protein
VVATMLDTHPFLPTLEVGGDFSQEGRGTSPRAVSGLPRKRSTSGLEKVLTPCSTRRG